MNPNKFLKENIAEANRSLTEKPLFATSVERFSILNEISEQYADLPQPLRFSKFLTILLSRVSTPVMDYDQIAGRCVDRLLTDTEEETFQSFLTNGKYHSIRKIFLSSGHCIYSWDMLVKEGLFGLREQAARSWETAEDEDKKIFFAAMVEVYDAIANYLLRYADAARARGMYRLADNLHAAATERPTSFAVALQLLWIVTMIDCAYITENPTLALGRLDQILYPLYRADLQNGTMTVEEARAYVTDYYCKHNLIMGRGEHQMGDATNSTTFKRICNFDAPQYLFLAGTDKNGNSAVNELTALFVDCVEPSFKNPVLVVRYFKGMNEQHPQLWKSLTEKALQSSSMMFYNDNNMLDTFIRMGIPEQEARNYAHFGCNWPTLGDRSMWMNIGPGSHQYNTYLNDEEKASLQDPTGLRMNAPYGWVDDFMIALRTLSKREDVDALTIDDVYDAFFARMEDFAERKLSYYSRELSVRQRKPSAVLTFGDCFLRESLEHGECVSASATYHFALMSFYMFGSVVDCFIAVDQLVFREKKVTLADLLAATDANFEGYEEILALCKKAEKYGSDTPLSNAHVKRISERTAELTIEKSRPYLAKQGLFLTPCLQSDTWHLKCGELYGATPDGRLAHVPFSQNSRPANGSCTNGITGMFNAMLNIPSDGFLSGALNLDVQPSQFKGAEGTQLFGSLLGTYFNHGGLHAQVTTVSADALIDAQKNPDAHRDLRVRVTGYSGIFVDMCDSLQNDIIERLK